MMTTLDYYALYATSKFTWNASKIVQLDYISRVAITHMDLYQGITRATSIPWPLIAAIHARESSQNFTKHLHNGDSLSARTVHVPAGRPVKGEPPFTWTQSAIDALTNVWHPKDWSIGGCLEFLERYNGLGYQKHGVNSPYLWSGTNKYRGGLFVADGTFDAGKFDKGVGCVAVVKTLALKGVSLDFTGISTLDSSLH